MKILLVIFALTTLVGAAPLVDLKASREAKDALALLASKGLIDKYPDGVFKGDRAASRFEVVKLLDRLESYMQTELGKAATKSDLKTVDNSVNVLHADLENLEDRVDKTEKTLKRQDLETR